MAKNLLIYMDQTGQKPDLSDLTINVNTASIDELLTAINKLMDEPAPGADLPVAEKALLGFGTPAWEANIKKYYWDARWATVRTIIHYDYPAAQENGTSIANAFKHAMFACYHAESFGLSLAIQLCTAHEEQPNTITSQMDNWNNSEGFKIWNTGERDFNRIDFLVIGGVRAGEMRWIKYGDNVLTPTH